MQPPSSSAGAESATSDPSALEGRASSSEARRRQAQVIEALQREIAEAIRSIVHYRDARSRMQQAVDEARLKLGAARQRNLAGGLNRTTGAGRARNGTALGGF